MDESTSPPNPGWPPPPPDAPASPQPPPAAPPPPPPVLGRVVMAQPAPQPRPRRGWMVFALVLLVLFGVSLLYNLKHAVTGSVSHGKGLHARTVGPKLEEVITEDNDAANKIAIVEIDGIIRSSGPEQGGYNLVDLIKAEFKRAEEDDKVKAVILKVDSPGGEVLASDEINRIITDFQKKTPKPVIGSMGNLAASGGYYVSAPCRWIVANDLTITGSIGVILHSWNYRALMDKVGLRPQTYKSGKFKDMLSGEREPEEIPSEERQMVQGLIDDTYKKFKNVVATGRGAAAKQNKDKGRTLDPNWTDYADGRVLSGTEAYNLGFVDELGNFEDAVKRAKNIAGISAANLVQYQQRIDLADIFRFLGKSEAPVIKVDLGMEPPKLQAGQLYFLSPTFAY